MQTTIALQTAEMKRFSSRSRTNLSRTNVRRRGAAKKAQKRHTDRAMQMMDRIGRFLDKYESETSESE